MAEHDRAAGARAPHRRQLEDVQDQRRRSGVHPRPGQGARKGRGSRGGGRAAVHRPLRGGEGGSRAPRISVAAQDVFWEWEGAYTGEVSAAMLADLGVKAAIIGHSERRRYFAETDESVAKKVWAALEQKLLPIMCVGENEEEREGGLTEEVLARQVPAGLASVRPEDAAKHRHRLRADLGHRHRSYGDPGHGSGGRSLRARAGGLSAWREGRRGGADTLWGQCRALTTSMS